MNNNTLQVLHHYKGLQGWSRGKSIINYLNKATELKGYGVHVYQVISADLLLNYAIMS